MTHEELIADTNRLLRELLDLEKAEAASLRESMERSDAQLEAIRRKADESLNQRIKDLGGTDEVSTGTNEDWEARLKRNQDSLVESMKAVREKEEQFQRELLEELRTQTQLLTMIAEKVHQ